MKDRGAEKRATTNKHMHFLGTQNDVSSLPLPARAHTHTQTNTLKTETCAHTHARTSRRVTNIVFAHSWQLRSREYSPVNVSLASACEGHRLSAPSLCMRA